MAVYAAVASFKNLMEAFKTYMGMTVPPLLLEIVEFVIKELNYIQECIERLDMSSRIRMKASLDRIPEVMKEFEDALPKPAEWMEENRLLDFKQHAHFYMGRLKKLVDDEEYRNDHPFEISSGSKMVGLSDEFTKLKLRLVYDWYESPFYALVGMAGIGKTTLAKKIFDDLDIMEWFNYRVWVTVGKRYQPEEIIRSILAQVDLDADEMPTGGFQKIVTYLKESLKDKQYLITLDDVWDINLAQHYLKFLFPNYGNRSRVFLTTRIQHESNDDPFSYHHLRLLNEEESWRLLCHKIFVEDTCPPELEKVRKMIAEKCDGLPLTIITVADLLSKADKTESFWNEIVAQKRHQLFTDAYDEISKVLYPSYEDLSDDLKLCFLYIGVFPQNYHIPKSKLINLWIAEKSLRKAFSKL